MKCILLLLCLSIMSDSLQPCGLQHARLPCPSLSPRVCSNSGPLNQWCHPTISSSVVSFLLLPSIFPSIRVFSNESPLCIRWPKYWSFSLSINPSNEYSGLIDLILLLSKGVSRVFSNTRIDQQELMFESINSLALSLLYDPTLTSIYEYWKNGSFDYVNFSWQRDVSAF